MSRSMRKSRLLGRCERQNSVIALSYRFRQSDIKLREVLSRTYKDKVLCKVIKYDELINTCQ